MPSQTILDASLGVTFAPSGPLLVVARSIVLNFELQVDAGVDAEVQWYFEFTDGPPAEATTQFYREVAQNVAGPVITMPAVIRTFKNEQGNNLAAASDPYLFTAAFERSQAIARIQMRALTGKVHALVTATGLQAVG